MDETQPRRGMRGDGELPSPLAELVSYSHAHEGRIACDFELTSDGAELATGFFRDSDLARSFAVFGHDGMLGLYSLWLEYDAVPVYLASDWDETGVLCCSLEEFVALLALGRERIGMVDGWRETDQDCEGIEDFRAWAQEHLGISTPSEDEARALVTRARAEHADLKQWIEERRSGRSV